MTSPLHTPPTRLAFAGDWHGNTAWARSAVSSLADFKVDTILHLGDFGIWPGKEGEEYLDELEEECAERDVRILFVDGNHEDFTQLSVLPHPDGVGAIRPRIFHLERTLRWEWEGIRFGALGGATSLDRPYRKTYVSWWPEEEITPQEAEKMKAGGELDILLTHDCPSGVNIPGLSGGWPPLELQRAHYHQHLLRQVVEEVNPALLYHGHFHQRYTDTLSLSNGSSMKAVGLDCDGTSFKDNILLTSLAELAEEVAFQRSL